MKEWTECQNKEKKSTSYGCKQNYVHRLQQGLWNRAASLGGEVPEQSGPHLAVQNKNRWSLHYTHKEH